MAQLYFQQVGKIFEDGTEAVRDFNLRCADGEFVVLVGPSGCGKSTLLRLVAGLEDVSTGKIQIGDRVVNDLPPQARNTAMVFQNYALYPHMTVRRNLAFPLRMSGRNRAETDDRVREVAGLLGLEGLLDRRPRQLSGGQRQRVAMGRALVRKPAVFLMDEPLSNLDAKLRVQMRSEIRILQRRLETTTLYVTHDQVEAMTMGDRLAVLHQGRLQQCGTPDEIYQQPANVFVATFIGSPAMNLFWVNLEQTPTGSPSFRVGDCRLEPPVGLTQPVTPGKTGPRLLCGLRPEAFTLVGGGDRGPNVTAQVDGIELLGHEQIVHFRTNVPVLSAEAIERVVTGTVRDHDAEGSGHLVARLKTATSLSRGDTVRLGIDVDALTFFAADGRALRPPIK